MAASRCADLKSRQFCSDRLSLDVCPVTCGHCPLKARLVCKDSTAVGRCSDIVRSDPLFCSKSFAIDICPVTCNLCQRKTAKILTDAFPSSPVLSGNISSIPASGRRSTRSEGILCPHCPYVQHHSNTADPGLLHECIERAGRCDPGDVCQMDLDKANIKGACHWQHPGCAHAPHHPCPPGGLADHCTYCCETDECVYQTLHQHLPTTTRIPVTPVVTHSTRPPQPVCQDKMAGSECAKVKAEGFCADRYSVEVCPVTCGSCDIWKQLQCQDYMIHQSCKDELAQRPHLCSDPYAISICPVTCNLCDQLRNNVLDAVFTTKAPPVVTAPLPVATTKVPLGNAHATSGPGAPSAPLTYTLTTPTPRTAAQTTTPTTTTVKATPTTTVKATPPAMKTTPTATKTTPTATKTTPTAVTNTPTTPAMTATNTATSAVATSTMTSAPVTSPSANCKDELVDLSCSDLKDVCSSSVAGLVCKRFCGLC